MVVSREEVLVAAAAWRLRRPVKWIEDRRESLSSGFQGHEQRVRARAAFAADGTLLALEADTASDVGAYSCYPMTAGVEAMMAMCEMPGTYRVPRYTGRAVAVATNNPPMAPYRGVGRPQAVFRMDRLMDKAARRLGIGRDESRWRNLIADEEFPYTGVTGIAYDRGSYRESLRRLLAALDFEGWSERQAKARAGGRLLGLGFACFSESTGFGTSVFGQRGMRVTPGYESADVRMERTGEVVVPLGVSAHGQGHRTAFAQIVADELGVDHDAIRVVENDTDRTPYGWGTFASRSTVVAGGASKGAAAALREKVQRLAAHLLEAAPGDIELRDGRAGVRGSPSRSLPIADVGRLAYHAAHRLPDGEEPGLAFRATFDPPGTYSNASHGAVVEVDATTGEVAVERYVVVGTAASSSTAHSSTGRCAAASRRGSARRCSSSSSGQCQTASFMDYLVPTAPDLPPIEIEHIETPSAHSETGAKGMGEGGMIGAPAAIANAVEDAVAHLGVAIDELPITPSGLWRALRRAQSGSLSSTTGMEKRRAS